MYPAKYGGECSLKARQQAMGNSDPACQSTWLALICPHFRTGEYWNPNQISSGNKVLKGQREKKKGIILYFETPNTVATILALEHKAEIEIFEMTRPSAEISNGH